MSIQIFGFFFPFMGFQLLLISIQAAAWLGDQFGSWLAAVFNIVEDNEDEDELELDGFDVEPVDFEFVEMEEVEPDFLRTEVDTSFLQEVVLEDNDFDLDASLKELASYEVGLLFESVFEELENLGDEWIEELEDWSDRPVTRWLASNFLAVWPVFRMFA